MHKNAAIICVSPSMHTLLLSLFLSPLAGTPPPPGDSLLIISLQRDFADPRRFSPAPQARWAELNAESGTEQWSDVENEAILEAAAGKDVLLMVHGLGVPLQRAMSNYRRLTRDSLPYDLLIGISWPAGQLTRSKLHNGLMFFGANARAKKSGERLGALMEAIALQAASLDVYTHSLGTKTALYSLKGCEPEAVCNLFLTAPAIGAKTLKPGRRYSYTPDAVWGKIMVFYSREDGVFRFPAHRIMGRRGILGVPTGEKFINVDCVEEIRRRHSGYWQSDIVKHFLREEGR